MAMCDAIYDNYDDNYDNDINYDDDDDDDNDHYNDYRPANSIEYCRNGRSGVDGRIFTQYGR